MMKSRFNHFEIRRPNASNLSFGAFYFGDSFSNSAWADGIKPP